MTRSKLFISALLLAVLPTPLVKAQSLPDPLSPPSKPGPLSAAPSLAPGVQFLFDLETKFEQATIAGGGAAFASFFAEDAVTISNKSEVKSGRSNIASTAKWSAADFQLTWKPQGGQMSPAGDMGFTWGHYDARGKDKDGKPSVTSGRYMTIWKRQADGAWKVAMDASNEEPPDCGCTEEIAPKPQ